MASYSQKRIIQITGFKKQEKKTLLKCLSKLNCAFVESKKYRNCTHLIAKKLCKSEKVLAACAAGKWVLTKEYIINSAESGRWLDETTYEWGYEIERDTHYSPQMQSAPKRWREELTNSSAPGAFHRWKVVLLVKRGDKRMACIERVLKAGKATICSCENAEHNITHVFIGGKISPLQNKKCLSEAQHYPLQYIGHYLFQNKIQNPRDTEMNRFLAAQETDQVLPKMQLGEMKNVIIKHMYFTVTIKHRFMRTDQLNKCNPEAFRSEVAGLLNAILGTVVDYWIISGLLMDRNVFHQVPDLAHYLAISCDDFSVCQLKMFLCAIPSDWLQLFVAEAIFKQMCLQRNITVSTEPLSLQKIVCSYSSALREIGMRETEEHKAKKKKIGQQPCPESQRTLQMLNGDKQNQVKVLPDLPAKTEVQTAHTRGSPLLAEEVHKRNIKGETALHKACRNNKVERLIQLLSLPGIDINVKDYAGWTPLHEACNHGSTVCVREILERCPEVDLLSQVDGVTPLHDALSNGHIDIGKLLLQHGGPVLLEQRNSHGKLPLDYVESVTAKEELLNLVYPGESIENFYECREEDFSNQKKELCLLSFTKMLINFCSVYNLSTPLTVTLRAIGCSNILPVMVSDTSKMKNAFSGHWLVDMYFKELETFGKLPQLLQEISESMLFFPGELAKTFLAVLETWQKHEACQFLNPSSS
ncbi:SMC5-SMC6 complex localization factor protein 1 isoform X3 [Zonotrichia leucophrys gambelii]|uniref:SMC5-SMC6 complex localization factor protein 1 isoform X3 n=1 Tax=Zonotrichia leucophrys gambelii TaxID=257770 RepID=UPI0031403704